MTTKREVLKEALSNITNPFFFAQNYDGYGQYCRLVLGLLDDCKTECHLVDDIIITMQSEIECCISCIEYQIKGIRYYWNMIDKIQPYLDIALNEESKWTDYENAFLIVNKIFTESATLEDFI